MHTASTRAAVLRASIAIAALAVASCSGEADPEPDPTDPVPIQQRPVAGLSTVESFPATPLHVTLNPNAALVNGDVWTSAGVNLGTAAGVAPIAYRDLGAQLQDAITPVSLIHVHADKAVPPDLAALFVWDAYRSDDNVDWTPVALYGAVVFDPADFAFEIPISRTQARYLKVVTKPLPAAASSDPLYREIFVTELQFFDLVPVATVEPF
jgi:hypothetical protein